MKNTRAPLLLALLFSVFPVFFACEKPDELIPVESVSLDKRSAEMIEGERLKLTATITPSNASNKNIGWKSDNPEIATVDQNGNVTALEAGKAIISAISEDGGKSATCAVTVKAKVIDVSSLTLSKTSASLKVGETVTLTATVGPNDATDKTITWTTSDETIATVYNGVVTAKKVGTATITAKAGDKTATCTITVVATPVESISLNQTSASLKAGETVTLTARVAPDDATDKTVTWSTTDETIATVADGIVTAKKVGTTTITAKAGDKTATCEITVVTTPVESISLDQTSASLKAGETVTLTARVAPDDATDKTVTWSTTDETIATVADGIVTAKKVGTTTITAKAGDKTATCEITVVATPVESISLSQTNASMKAGETVTLIATVGPNDATDKTVTWTTSDETFATVSNGVVTAKKVGTATITAKAGDKMATCAITVIPTPVTSISLNKTSYSMKAGETVMLTATVGPNDATDKTVTWTTSDETIATVSNGVVTAKKVGTATITAKAGDKTATCAITVIPTPVISVSLSQTSATMTEGESLTLTATISPDDATNQNVAWSSSNSNVASVDSEGKVTAVKAGSAIITVRTEDGGKTATCEITVIAKVRSVSLNKTTATITEGETLTLIATITPANATNKNVKWSSSDASIASVNETGRVSAIKPGTATITVETEDGGKTATCTITVQKKNGGTEDIGHEDWNI